MAQVAKYAIDTSALARIRQPSVASVLHPLISAGLVATLSALDFEDLYSARSAEQFREMRWIRRTRYENLPTEELDWQRALEIQATLADMGRWRDAGLVELIVAAVCERHRVTVLHYDSDFETIAEITGQDARWVVPRGSVA